MEQPSPVAGSPTSVVKNEFRKFRNDESKLRQLIRSKSVAAHGSEANALRENLMACAEKIMTSDIAFAVEKELEQSLWKSCIYKCIEDFRRRLRKYVNATSGSDSTDPKIIEHFHRLSSEFRLFLDNATCFYERLNAMFRACFDSSDYSISTRTNARQCCHRCMVFLGDLARYRELHNQKKKKDYGRAESYYLKALAVLPQNGNPHNQLAVLATYAGAEAVAVYRYSRSLLVQRPFSTSIENLCLLFEKNRLKTVTTLRPDTAVTISSEAKEKTCLLKFFLHRFIYLTGTLFANGSPSRSTTTTNDDDDYMIYNTGVESQVVQALTELLACRGIGDAIILKLFVICMFSIERLLESPCEDGASEMLSHSISLLLKCLTVVILHVKENAVESAVCNSTDADMNEIPSWCRFLGPVSVISDYLTAKSSLLLDFKDIFHKTVEQSLMSLLQQLQSLNETAASTFMQLEPSLTECIELRGFTPLESCNAVYGSNQQMSSISVPEGKALAIRSLKLIKFGRLLQASRIGSSDESSLMQPENATSTHLFDDMPIDDDGDDEVIVYKPLAARKKDAFKESLSDFNTEPLATQAATPKSVPPGFDSSAGQRLQINSADEKVWGGIGQQRPAAASAVESKAFLPNFLVSSEGNPNDALAALEKQTEIYEYAGSSLSQFLTSPAKSAAPSPLLSGFGRERSNMASGAPPGFSSFPQPGVEDSQDEEARTPCHLQTSNPFLVGNT